MEVQTEALKEILGELFTLLEAQETHSVAILQFLKDQGIATDEKLASYLEQAGRASNVKWLAARKRMEYLLTPIQKEPTDGNKDKEKAQETGQEKGKQKDKGGEKEKPEPAQALAQEPVHQKSASENRNPGKQTEKNESADHEKPAESGIATSAQKTTKAQMRG
jgi:hypothetical protein